MRRIDVLGRHGAIDILRLLCLGESKFKGLNGSINNTRTLTRRLKELTAEGLIEKDGSHYKITSEGFEAAFKIAELEVIDKGKRVDREELLKIRHAWMRVSLRVLTELFMKRFGDELISIILYGSAVTSSFQLGRSDVDLLYILEDKARNVWQSEGYVFKDFRSSWEYRACDYWLKKEGFYGYPEVTTASLHKGNAKTFQYVYLDMLANKAVLYDKGFYFSNLMEKLEDTLKTLGTVRIQYADGTYCWFLKPDVAPGELIEISLG